MTVKDVLIGSETVMVKRDGRDNTIEFEKSDETTVLGSPSVHDEEVVTAIQEAGLSFKSQFPVEFNYYLHDDSEPHNYREVAEETGLDEDSDTVRRIAGVGYEVELTVRVMSEDDWEITHVFGHELKEPYSG